MTDPPKIQLIATPDFQAQLRKLAKRYRNLRNDLQPLLDDLESGNCPGDQIAGTTDTVFKVRVKNSDIQKGKSEGYRVIYQRRDDICILLVTIYSKSDEGTLTAKEVCTIIDAFNKLNELPNEE
jgi:mRNA-degrading endonuclease RelE of RelBE toxin-antitoxin system